MFKVISVTNYNGVINGIVEVAGRPLSYIVMGLNIELGNNTLSLSTVYQLKRYIINNKSVVNAINAVA